MTAQAIQEQVNTIKRATDKASRSKKDAKAFLAAAGIITATPVTKGTKRKK